MIQGMKEQQATIDSLKEQIRELNRILFPAGENSNNINPGSYQIVELSTENIIILNQNDPNPFAEETKISYHLPENINEAKILFYDNTGRVIKAVELHSRGNGVLHIYASNLSSGNYTYALIVDGKLIESKKMTKLR